MSKLILSSRYLRAAPPGHLSNYVRYISTRDGVEKIDESKKHLPVTSVQKNFIEEMIRDIPAAKDMLEYTDFLLQPTMGNATELISRTMEEHVDLIAEKANYVDYIANRPRVERVGEHGLFTDAGKPVILSKVQQEVAEHQGVIWTHVISLRREDAARLGYDHADQWMALLRSKRAMFSTHMKIDSKNLRWYAAFHNEGHHPHVHMIVYSAKEKDGYLTKESIEAMRAELSHDIFRQDFANIYEEQKQARADLKTGTEEILRELVAAIESRTLYSPAIEEKMLQLSKRLQKTKGKKVYGYLKRDVRDLIDSILDELQKDKRISELYQVWGRWQNEIYLMYSNRAPELPPLSKNPKLKSLKNMVITEALQLGGHHISYFEQSAEQGNQYAQYMLGKLYLCGRDVPRDKEKAISYLQASAAQGNIYAQFFLDHLDSFRDPSVFLCATNLMHHLSNLIREDTAYKNAGGIRYQMDQKRRKKLLEKRRAQGQKGHIMETQQVPYQ